MIYTGKFKLLCVFHNTNGWTPEQVKDYMACDTVLNGVLFNGDGSLCLDNKINGKWISNEGGNYTGLAWDNGEIPIKTITTDEYDNFISCCPVAENTKRGRTAIGFNGDEYTVLCVPDGVNSLTYHQAEEAIKGKCPHHYLVLDGGGSSYLSCPAGVVDTIEYRKKANRTYLCIYEKTPLYRIQFGAFGDKNNAIAYQQTLKESGYSTIIKNDWR